MKKMVSLLIILILAVFVCLPVNAAETDHEKEIDKTIKYLCDKFECKDVHSLVDDKLSQSAGKSGDWYVFALRQNGTMCDYSKYAEALKNNTGKSNASSAMKNALMLMACETQDAFITDSLDLAAEDDSVMTQIYALHLLNNGAKSTAVSADSVTQKLLSMRRADGGWSVTGETSDVDVTAMALQALSCRCSDSDITAAVDEALVLLSDRQLENGGFTGLSGENSESCSQVVIALNSLGIDILRDERFIKNGNTPMDALLSYRTQNGSFRHSLSDSDGNEMATQQALCALVSCKRQKEGRGSLYLFDTPLPQKQAPQGVSVKFLLCIVIAALAFVVCVVQAVRKKLNRKNLLFVFILSAAAVAAVLLIKVESTSEHFTAVEGDDITTEIKIVCYAEESPKSVILKASPIGLENGSTAYDQLLIATRKYGIQMEHNGIVPNVYIEGIDDLYEFDCGELSGWMYRVNGQMSDKGCGEYVLSDGDEVEWIYTDDMGAKID